MPFRYAFAMLATLTAVAVDAQPADSRYFYGPMNSRGDGYKDKLTKDGFWQVDAGVSHIGSAIAIDFAIYRAEELARANGYRYVEIHDASGRSSRLGGAETATLYARPAEAPAHPTTCRSGKPKRCYTADIALVYARLSGADGQHPGVAAPSYVDKFGRPVMESGFGTGAVGSPPAR